MLNTNLSVRAPLSEIHDIWLLTEHLGRNWQWLDRAVDPIVPGILALGDSNRN